MSPSLRKRDQQHHPCPDPCTAPHHSQPSCKHDQHFHPNPNPCLRPPSCCQLARVHHAAHGMDPCMSSQCEQLTLASAVCSNCTCLAWLGSVGSRWSILTSCKGLASCGSALCTRHAVHRLNPLVCRVHSFIHVILGSSICSQCAGLAQLASCCALTVKRAAFSFCKGLSMTICTRCWLASSLWHHNIRNYNREV